MKSKIIREVTFLSKYNFLINLMVILFISFVLFWYGNLLITEQETQRVCFASGEKISAQLQSGDVVEQEFYVSGESICGLRLLLGTYGNDITQGTVNVKIIDDEGEVCYNQDLLATEIKDCQYWNIYFDDNILKKKHSNYYLRMEFLQIDNQTISFWMSEDGKYEQFSLKINNTEDVRDIVLVEIIKDDYFHISYLCIILCFFALLIITYLLIFKSSVQIWNLYLLVGLFLGLLYLLIIPLYEVPDEERHIFTAYEVSNSILGIENDLPNSSLVMRWDDAENGFIKQGITREYYHEYYKKLGTIFVENEELVGTTNLPLSTLKYLFYLSGLGITFGRCLQLSTIYTFFLGRFFNLLFFVFATYYSIKKIPIGKTVVFLWAILPMTLQEVASFSYDAPVYALCVLVVSLSIHLAYSESIQIFRRDYIILYICAMLLVPAKSFALLPLCFLTFIIGIKKYRENRKIVVYTLGLLVGMICVMIICQSLYAGSSNQISGEHIVEWANEKGYTLKGLLSDPQELFIILGNTFFRKADFYLKSLLGSSLGWFEINIPFIVVLPYFIMMLIAGMKKKGETIVLQTGIKIYICLIGIMGMGVACMAMLLEHTPISYRNIEGVQGRYILPYVLSAFLLMRSSNIEISERVNMKMQYGSIWLAMVVFICIYVGFII